MAASPPLPLGARLVSDMGMRRGIQPPHPQRFHAGMDVSHPHGVGTPVLSVAPGTVMRVLSNTDTARAFAGYGNGVIIDHGDGLWALYAHQNRTLVQPGQRVDAGDKIGEMGATNNGKFRGMGPHLHLEFRRARDGRAPFPGPYPTPATATDPRGWLEQKGLIIGPRGAFDIRSGSEMSQIPWQGVSGVDPYPRERVRGWMIPETALGQVDEDNAYVPPQRFDRDARFGLTPLEWAAAGAGVIVLTSAAIAFIAFRPAQQVRANRRRARRRLAA